MNDRQASDDDQAAMITVEVAYATPARQLIVPLVVPEGTTAYEAVQAIEHRRRILRDRYR